MEDILFLACLLVVLIMNSNGTINIFPRSNTDNFSHKPNSEESEEYTNTILANRGKFASMNTAKAQMPWLDAITYEDIRKLISKDQFDKKHVSSLF
jgi:hypothetical protein